MFLFKYFCIICSEEVEAVFDALQILDSQNVDFSNIRIVAAYALQAFHIRFRIRGVYPPEVGNHFINFATFARHTKCRPP